MITKDPKNEQLGSKKLREFALTVGGAICLMFGAILPWVFERQFPLWPWIVGGVLIVWGIVAPSTLSKPYLGWMKLGHLLGRITTPVMMFIIFAVLITPLGIVLRLLGKDPLNKKYDSLSSYRVKSQQTSREGLERPF